MLTYHMVLNKICEGGEALIVPPSSGELSRLDNISNSVLYAESVQTKTRSHTPRPNLLWLMSTIEIRMFL